MCFSEIRAVFDLMPLWNGAGCNRFRSETHPSISAAGEEWSRLNEPPHRTFSQLTELHCQSILGARWGKNKRIIYGWLLKWVAVSSVCRIGLLRGVSSKTCNEMVYVSNVAGRSSITVKLEKVQRPFDTIRHCMCVCVCFALINNL